MRYAVENSLDSGDQTRYAGLLTATQHSYPGTGYLVVIRKNNEIVEIFRPQENHFTIGRSSKNSIILPDPSFPRMAGEIILGPIPILRKENNKNKDDNFISIHPGKSYHLQPYTLTLLEPGEIIINRNKNKIWSKVLLPGIVSFVVLFLGTSLTIYQFQGDSRPSAVQEQTYSLTYSNDKETELREMKDHSNIDIQTTKSPEKATSSIQIPLSKGRKTKKASISAKKTGLTSTANQQPVAIRSKVPSYENEIDKAIISAELSAKKGYLEVAGRILNPLLPHADENHRNKIIDTLDPYVQTIFKKAYMLRFYEPEKSREMLQEIVDSGIKILPGYRKAIRALGDIKNESD